MSNFPYSVKIFLLILSVALFTETVGANDVRMSQMRKAEMFADSMKYDSALNIYQRIASDYRPEMPSGKKRVCLDAIFGCCNSNLYLGNYIAAFNDLLLAEDICGEMGITDTRFHLYNTSLYIVLASQTGKRKYIEMAVPHARMAFARSYKNKDYDVMLRSYGDLVLTYAVLEDKNLVERETDMLRRLGSPEDWRFKEALLKYDARRLMVRKDYAGASACFDSIISIIPRDIKYIRPLSAAIKDKALATGLGGNERKSIKLLGEVLRLSYLYNQRDLRLSALNTEWIMAKEAGDSTTYHDALNHAVALKDSLRSYMIADGMIELEYVKERKELQQKIASAKLKHTIMTLSCVALAAVVLIVSVFLLVVRRKNRILAHRADLLRNRMREIYASLEIRTEPTRIQTDSKYVGSCLTDKDKQEIAGDIEKILHSEAVLSADFSLNVLAEKAGHHPKSVSQVINEVFSSNFPSLVNQIRIAEACRRFDDPAYSNWSVEGIAESVGFRSRSSFSANFKKITGIGIREYRKSPGTTQKDN